MIKKEKSCKKNYFTILNIFNTFECKSNVEECKGK